MTAAIDDPQLFASMAELQNVIARHLIEYRREIAESLRRDAEGYELRALTADHVDAKELEWIAYGLRVAAAKVDPT